MYLKILSILISFVLTVPVFTQTEKLPDELPKKMNQKQWEFVRDLYAVDAIKLLAKMDTLALEIDSLNMLLLYTENFDCETELYALVGATKEQVADFRIKFDEAESYISSRKNSPDDASKNYFNTLSASKLRCLPEFSDRFASLKVIVDNYIPIVTEKTPGIELSDNEYKVKEGDNLTGISLRIYGKASLWILIWEANKTEIDNPDFLYPGQILVIPNKSR